MGRRSRSTKSKTDKWLDELLSDAAECDSSGFQRPDDEVLYAFLQGTADAEQRAAVLKAIRQSSDYRREVIAAKRDLDRASN